MVLEPPSGSLRTFPSGKGKTLVCTKLLVTSKLRHSMALSMEPVMDRGKPKFSAKLPGPGIRIRRRHFLKLTPNP
jgi:hypothetical protein